MHVRGSFAYALAIAIVVPASPAVAAPHCRLLVDPEGDAPPTLDVVSGDVATGHQTVVVALRLKKTSNAAEPPMLLGAGWVFRFSIRGTSYTFERRRPSGTTERYVYRLTPNPTNATLTTRESPTEVRWTVRRSAIPELRRPGSVFEKISATTATSVVNVDLASTARTYRDRSPSCLRPA